MPLGRALLPFLLALTSCTGEAPRTRTPEDFGEPTSGDVVPSAPREAPDPSDALPEVTKSGGHKGGFVVLWPRVVASGAPVSAPVAHDLAVRAQQRLEMLARRVGGARHVDVRPEPEVRCPHGGCEATSVSAVVVAGGGGCAVVVFAAGAKKSPGRLLPWAGKTDLASEAVAFGQSPEGLVKGKELVPCEKLFEGREDAETAIARHLRGLLPGG